MGKIVSIKATDGTRVDFEDDIIASGCLRDAYLSEDKSYVVAFYREGGGRSSLLKQMEAVCDFYWNCIRGSDCEELFVWPQRIVKWKGRIGYTEPVVKPNFYFEGGKFKGKEKTAKWFVSAKLRNKFVEPEFLGDWRSYFQLLIDVARGMKLLHSAGFLYADFNFQQVFVDPRVGHACLFYDDNIVKPGVFSSDICPTPDFCAPEKIVNMKAEPKLEHDLHALAVLIYELLLYRHPLRGSKVHDKDPAKDEELMMGKNALFVEHPNDDTNRINIRALSPLELPQSDTTRFPYTICGPHMMRLFDKAFIDGLHNPSLRPTEDEWIDALEKTLGMSRGVTL